jgi:hypothetical protein
MKRVIRTAPANVTACIALAVALSGTSYAAFVLPANSVGTKQLKNRSIQRLDIGRKTIASLRGQRGPQGPAGLQGAQGIPGVQGSQGIQGSQGTQGVQGVQGVQGDVGPTFGRSGASSQLCNPGSATFVVCATTGAIALPAAGRVLLVATSEWDDSDAPVAPNRGACRLRVDGTTTVGPFLVGFGEDTLTHQIGSSGSVTDTAVTAPGRAAHVHVRVRRADRLCRLDPLNDLGGAARRELIARSRSGRGRTRPSPACVASTERC